jgi:hypothetical protein
LLVWRGVYRKGRAYPGGYQKVVVVPEGAGFEVFAVDPEGEEEKGDGDKDPECDSH